MDQSTVSGTTGDNKQSNAPVQEADLLGINNSGLDDSPGLEGHSGDSESDVELAGAKSRFGSIIRTVASSGVGEPKEANDRSAPCPETQLGASLSSRTPEEVSKEELLDILQKMNKRVKALSALRVTLTERVKSSEKDRSRLLDFVKEEVLTRADVEEASVAAAEKNTQIAAKQAEHSDGMGGSGHRKIDEIGMLQMAWRAADERNAMSLQAIQSEYKNLTIQHRSELEKIRNTMKNEMDAKVAKLKADATDPERDGNESNNTEIELRKRIDELSSYHQVEMERVQQQHQDEMLRIREEIEGNVHDTKEAGLEHISKEEYESRLKEAKLETAKQVKDAYEKKLSAIKEKAKAFVEKTKKDAAEQIAAANKEAEAAVTNLGEAQKQSSSGTADRSIHSEEELDDLKAQAEAAAAGEKELETQREAHETVLQSLQEQHKKEIDALQSKYSEGVASVGREKNEEVLGLRDRVADLEGALQASKEDASSQLDQMKRELTDTSSLLEESKRSEAAISAELDNLKSQAEAAAAGEKELETQREAHETALQSLQEQHKKEIDALQSKYSEGVASVGREKDEEVLGLRDRVADLEGALQASKEDASSQLDQMKRELTDTSSLLEESKRSEAAISTELDNLKAQAEAAAVGEKELETQREAHETALQSLQEQHKKEIDALQSKYSEGVASVGREKDEEVLGLRDRVADLEGALQASKEDASSQLDQMKRELTDTSSLLEESKRSEAAISTELDNLKAQAEAAAVGEKELETQREAHETALQSLQEQHKKEIDALQSKYSEGVASVGREKDEEVLGLRDRVADLEGALQASKEDASSQLDQMKRELTDTSSLLEESKRSEAAISAELDNLKAQAEAAAVGEKELETQREAHETALQSLQEQHKKEIDVLQSKYSEGVASVGREKNEEVLGLRDRVADLEGALQASKEDASSQLDQMKRELTDTSSLLEESKRSEAAISTELDNLKAQAEAAAVGEKELETQREAHETALQSLQEQHKKEIDALQSKYSEGVASVGREKDEEVLGLRDRVADLEGALQASRDAESRQSSDSSVQLRQLQQSLQEEQSSRIKSDEEVAAQKQLLDSLKTEHLAEVNSIRDESSAKINAAMQKHTKAMEYVKKLKAATAEKLKTIGEERVAERDKMEADKAELVSGLGQKYADDLRMARDSERTHWEEIVSDLKSKIVSLEEKLQAEHILEERSEKAELERNRAIEMLKEEKEKSEEELKAQQLAALEAAKQEKQMEFDRMKSNLEAKLESSVTEHSKAKAELEERMAKHADELKVFYEGKLNAALTQAKSDLGEKEDEVSQLLLQVKSSEEAVTQLRENNEALQLQAREHSDVHKALKQRIDELREEISINAANSSATAQSLVKEQEVLQDEAKTLKSRISVLSEEKESDKKAIEAFQVEVDRLRGQVQGLLKEKEVFKEKLNEGARKENKLSVAETELSILREEVNKLKLNESKSSSLVTRLQAEKEASQRKHGQQTALIGMLEAQLGELNESSSDSKAKLEAALYDIGQRDENIVSLRDQLEKSEREVAQLASRKAQSDSFAQHAADKEAAKKAKMVEVLQKELQVLQQQMARKSAAAQRLLQERETECNELRKTNRVLQNEVDKGSLSDRRIFELAAQQSSRESVAAAEIELRDKLVQRLAEKLESRDSDLASAEYTVQRVEGQVEELCRVRRREDVNLDYLKSIVVQYLSKPPGSSERAALLPVLATLLQFDASDYEAIEAGKANLSWWGSIVPKEIAPSTPSLPVPVNPPPPAPTPAKPRPTTLEF